MEHPLSIGIIGLGLRMVEVWRNLHAAAGKRVRLVGYADPSPIGLPALQKLGTDPGTAFTDHQTMLAALRPDVVMIGSPNHLHLEHIRAALDAGCRVFAEKPVVVSVAQTLDCARLIRQHGADRLLVGLVLRSSPLFRAMRAAAPRLGRLISIEANEHLSPEHGGFLMRDWRRRREWAGSFLLEKCCHDFDLLHAHADSRLVRVASFGGRNIFLPAHAALEQPLRADGRQRYRTWGRGWQGTDDVFHSDADVVDNQVVIGEFANGVRLSFHSNTHAPLAERRQVLFGTHGTLDGSFGPNQVRLRCVEGPVEDLSPAAPKGAGHYGADVAMGRDLAACLLDGQPFPVTAKAALEAGLAAMAADRAMYEGVIVNIVDQYAALDAILPSRARTC
jgi:predicted dehydrogenase